MTSTKVSNQVECSQAISDQPEIEGKSSAQFYDPETYDWEIGDSQSRKERMQFYVELSRRLSSPLLELGCGTGGILIELARNHRVFGVDISSSMLERCVTKLGCEAEDVRRRVELIISDMTNVKLSQRFGGVFAPYHVIQHILTPSDVEECFRNVFLHLQPGGEFVFDVEFRPVSDLSEHSEPTPDVVEFQDTRTPIGTYRVRERKSFNGVSQIITKSFDYKLICEGRETRSWSAICRQRLMTPEEIRLHLHSAGFINVDCFAAFSQATKIIPGHDIVFRSRREPY